MKGDREMYLTIQEVADKLGLAYVTVYGYCRTGKIPCIQFDRTYRISERELEKFLKTLKVKAVAK
ncbi:hypothetical protein ES705_44386 [subsurface metagenome]